MRKIGIMIGSDSDLPQCLEGFYYLEENERQKKCEVVKVITNSIHRNTDDTLQNFIDYTLLVDVWVIGAGMANHLTGTLGAYNVYAMQDKTPVIGVAFKSDNPNNTMAAILSITKVPGTQVIFNNYVGEKGFFEACVMAVEGKLPEIQLKKPKPVEHRTLQQAITTALEKIKQKEG